MASMHLPVVILILSVILGAVKSEWVADTCDAKNNYTANSTYGNNLKKLTTALLLSIDQHSGFFNYTVGNKSDQVFGLALCRGDQSVDSCRSCVTTTINEASKSCPYGKEEIYWYEQCFLHYSPTNFFSTVGEVSYSFCNQIEAATNTQEYNNHLDKLMNSLITQAVNVSKQMFAADFVELGFTQSNSNKLYGVVQCTRDLSKDDCYTCLQNFIEAIPSRCYNKNGGRLVGTSCMIRYESYLFYNGTIPISTTRSNGKKITILVVSPVVAAVIILAICVCLWARIKQKRNNEDIERNDGSLVFHSSTIKSATNNFSEENKLGEGGFGPVYKGTLTNGHEIAVKRLSRNSQQGVEQLRNEVVILAKLQHNNLVKLYGFCLDGLEKLLVFEFLSNTSLEKFLFDPLKSFNLDWQTRLNIIEGVGRGLVYLHEDSRLKIIHRDLKASNILLDEDLNPKISDFGLAKLFQVDETHANTSRIAGTYGYMAPEYAMQGQFSTKSDVYSYGILLLEILTGRTSNYNPDEMDEGLLSYVWRNWKQGAPLEVIDKNVTGKCPSQELIRCLHIALLCIQEDPSERPNMGTVLLMIRSQSMTLPAPAPPPISFQTATITVTQTSHTEKYSMTTSECVETERSTMEDR